MGVPLSAGDVMRVRAVRGVRAGAQLTVHYVSLMEPRRVRQQQLAEEKHFACACKRCSEPLAPSTDRFLEAHFAALTALCVPPVGSGWIRRGRTGQVLWTFAMPSHGPLP